jgi:hypothetical protein
MNIKKQTQARSEVGAGSADPVPPRKRSPLGPWGRQLECLDRGLQYNCDGRGSRAHPGFPARLTFVSQEPTGPNLNGTINLFPRGPLGGLESFH